MNTSKVTPAKILQLGTGFWGSKTLLSAVELGLFTELAKGSLDAATLAERLQLHPRSARDFFDALVALGMLNRTGTRYAIPRKPPGSLTATNLLMSAAFWKCATRGYIRSGGH